MLRMKTLILTGCLIASSVCSQATFAQSDLEKATVVFDLRLDMMKNGKTMKSLGITDEQLKQMSNSGDGIDISTAERIIGAMSLPNSVQEFAEMQNPGADIPMDFFVQIKFKDAAAAKAAYDKAEADSETTEVNGKTYIRPPNSPENIIAQMYDSKTMEIGTKKYILQSERGKELFTEGLQSAWKEVPNHSFRMAVDLDGERELLNQALEMAKQQSAGAPNEAMMNGYLGLFNNARNLRFSFDLDNEILLELGATGVDSDKAAELKSGLESLLTTAKMGGAMMAGQIPDKNASKLVSEILNSLAAKNTGDEVRISIPRPKSMDAAIESAKGMIQGMLGGGAGPGGPDF